VTKWLINYADLEYYEAQKLNAKTGLAIGGFDRVIQYGRQHLDKEFCTRNRDILSVRLGAGSWLWKPYLVVMTLRHVMAEGDVLFYCDSDCQFIGPVARVVDLCVQQREKPILLFTLHPTYSNRRFTKRDCFYYMDLDRQPYTELTQTLSGYFVCQKTNFTMAFFEEWLLYAQDPRILTGIPNQCGLPNYPDFFEHRADQSILSLLGRKYNVSTVPDISQWGNGERPMELPQIIWLTPTRD